jgi:hypothetical protein
MCYTCSSSRNSSVPYFPFLPHFLSFFDIQCSISIKSSISINLILTLSPAGQDVDAGHPSSLALPYDRLRNGEMLCDLLLLLEHTPSSHLGLAGGTDLFRYLSNFLSYVYLSESLFVCRPVYLSVCLFCR